MSNAHECAGGETLIFACSGAADVGAVSDRAARQMTRDGIGKMFCLAGVGGRVEGIVQKTRAASRIVAIDGCSLDCAKKCLDQVGIGSFQHLRVTDLGMEKGQTPPNDENVAATAKAAAALLA
jgi:uncharacterized metal-binding protein